MARSKKLRNQFAVMTVGVVAVCGTFCVNAGPAVSETFEKIKSRGVFEVCLSPKSMPLSTVFDGEKGVHVDLSKALARELGVSARFGWIQFRYQAKYTECDAFVGVGIIPGVKDEGRLKKSKPFMQFDTLMVTNPGKTISNLSELDGLTVATQSGSLSHAAIVTKTKATARLGFTDEEDLLANVADGSVDVGIVTNIGYAWYLHKNPDAKFNVQPAKIFQDITGYAMAIGLRNSDEAAVVAVNDALDRLKSSGEMCKIFTKYGLQSTLGYSCQ